MYKVLLGFFFTFAMTTFIACDDGSSTSPSNQEQPESDITSSSSGNNGSGKALGRPSYYGECPSPVTWSSLDTSSTPTPESSSSSGWATNEKYRFDPTGTFCDRLDIMNQDTWNYAYRYTDNNGRDTTTSYISYRINKGCLIEVSQEFFIASPSQHIKKAGTSYTPTIGFSACLQDECMSVMDIAASFNTIKKSCLDKQKTENIEFFPSLGDIPIDTSIYVEEALY